MPLHLGNYITLLVATSVRAQQDILLFRPMVSCQQAQRSTSLTTAAEVKVPVPASNKNTSCMFELHA